MYRVLTCLTTQHDYRLLALAIAVCVAESFIAFYVYWQVSQSHAHLNRIWITIAGLCTGGSIWATHFIAILAYDSGVRPGFEPILTLISLLIAVAMTGAGFLLAFSGPQNYLPALGGLVIGLGTAAMHFTGMAAFEVPGIKTWDGGLVASAVILGCLLAMAAMLVFHHNPGLQAVFSASALMALSIAVLHFTAMGALTITPDPDVLASPAPFSEATMAIGITVVTVLVLGAGFIASLQESRAARESAVATRELVDASTDALVLALGGVVVDVNSRAVELWGRPALELRGRAVFGDLLPGDPPERIPGEIFTIETQLETARGELVPVEIVRQPLRAASLADEVFSISDLRPLIQTTERLRRMNEELQSRERELQIQNLRFDTALAHMRHGLCMFDSERRIVVSNRRYAELFGLTLDQVKPGTMLDEVIERRIARGIYAGESPEAYRRWKQRHESAHTDVDIVQELNDGRSIAVSLRQMPGGGYVSTYEDVTERRRIEEQLVHMAHHDPLTDLPNRVLLRERLDKALAGSRRGGPYLQVLMLDLDRFKEINDTLGHLAGDALIKGVAARLREGLRATAMVARFGGDEFAIVEGLSASDDPTTLPQRVHELIEKPMEITGHTVSVGTTIGVALAPEDGTDPDTLLKNADLALYRAKSESRGSSRFFEPAMDRALQERRILEQDLSAAFAAGQLTLQYQPLLNLARDEISGFEALMRWDHPVHGLISPTVLIPILEDTGHMAALTKWVLREACMEAARWPGERKVAVNLSVLQFKARTLLPMITEVLYASRLNPRRLELEITETVMLKDAEGAFALFRQIRELGVRIALDDFGTGFSSLSYLLRFPFDKIKIDRSFINNLAEGGNPLVLVRSLIQMARGLGVETTAEGVESREQFDIVRTEGCTEAQGFYIGAAVPPASISAFRAPARRQESAVA